MLCYKCKSKMTETRETYHYTISGLNNVYLENIKIYKCDCGEESPFIPMVPEVNKEIGLMVLKKSGPLNGDEIKFLRKNLRLKAAEFIGYLRVNKSTYSRWENKSQMPSRSNDIFIRILFASLKGLAKDVIQNILEAGKEELSIDVDSITISSSFIQGLEEKIQRKIAKKQTRFENDTTIVSFNTYQNALLEKASNKSQSTTQDTSNGWRQDNESRIAYDNQKRERALA